MIMKLLRKNRNYINKRARGRYDRHWLLLAIKQIVKMDSDGKRKYV